MKKVMKLAAVAAVVVMSFGASAFAEPRHQNETNGWRDSRRSSTLEGRVRSFNRDGNGYRVQLDRDNRWYHVPQSAFRGRHNDLKIGVSLRFNGYYTGNDFFVDSCDFVGYGDDNYRDGSDRRYGYDDREYLRGIVESVDYRRGTLTVRDDRSGRRVRVSMAGGNYNRRGVDLNDLRRGDVVTFAGDWHRNGVFEAYRIESIRNGRR